MRHLDTITTTLTALRRPHGWRHGCLDGVWYNEPVSGRRCPQAQQLDTTLALVVAMAEAPHAAAHDTAVTIAVAEGMTGLVLADLPEEDREGWRHTAALAIEALCTHLARP